MAASIGMKDEQSQAEQSSSSLNRLGLRFRTTSKSTDLTYAFANLDDEGLSLITNTRDTRSNQQQKWFLIVFLSFLLILLSSPFSSFVDPRSSSIILDRGHRMIQHQRKNATGPFRPCPLVVGLNRSDSISLFAFTLKSVPKLLPLSATLFAEAIDGIDNATEPDYGGLVLDFTSSRSSIRTSEDDQHLQSEKEAQMDEMDVIDVRALRFGRTRPTEGCHKLQWTRQQFPSCHAFHENDFTVVDDNDDKHVVDDNSGSLESFLPWKYLGSGHFRDAFLVRKSTPVVSKKSSRTSGAAVSEKSSNVASVVLKSNRLQWYMEWTEDNLDRVRREALLMYEMHLSPRINTIYGHCGSSILVKPGLSKALADAVLPFYPDYQSEPGRITQQNLTRWQQDFGRMGESMNMLSDNEKLDIALQLAESLAELAGFHKSPIVHDDMRIDQWLISAPSLNENDLKDDSKSSRPRQTIVLNDMNSPFFMRYHPETGEYCQQYRIKAGPIFRAAEELDGGFVDDKMDVWPFGDILFQLLTGTFVAGSVCSEGL